MDQLESIPEQLKALLEEYKFNQDTLCKYLSLSKPDMKRLADGGLDGLPGDATHRFQLFHKISFLTMSAAEDKDLKLEAFLQALLSYYHLSKETIAKMAGVEKQEVEKLLSNPPGEVPLQAKYKVAVTVMALRFFLKECEPR